MRSGIDPANIGRRGRRWNDAKRACFELYGDQCWVCGHYGAREVDHVIPVSQGGAPYDIQNLRPAHGSNSPCMLCKSRRGTRGRSCNQERNKRAGRLKAMSARVRISRG